MDPTTALTMAIENSTKVAGNALFSTVIDKMLGFKISEWAAQGDVIKKQIIAGYEEAKQKGMGVQYVDAFRQNTNLISVATKAAEYIDPTKQNEISFDNDVFWGLLGHAKEISNDDMQALIARIIAGEYNAPGTYSMSTLQTIKMLGKVEIELFQRMCSLLINEDHIPKELFLIEDDAKVLMNGLSIDFGSLQTLQSLGLFLPNDMSITTPNPEKKQLRVMYFDRPILFVAENDNFQNAKIPPFYSLSEVGKQILIHIQPKFNEEYYLWLRSHYKIPNYKLRED